MKRAIRSGLKRALYACPTLIFEPLLIRVRHIRSRLSHPRYVAIHRKLGSPWASTGKPFQGMKHVPGGFGGCVINRMLGSYECELHEQIERVCASNVDLIVNVGGAEGYYAVGMALRNPSARVVVFEGDKGQLAYLHRAIRLNDVGNRVDVRGWCTPELLSSALKGSQRPCIIMDCEGGEDTLLDPDRVPGLGRSIVIVEVHEQFSPGVGERLKQRFAVTHELEVIHSTVHRQSQFDPETTLTPEEFAFVDEEHRSGEMDWFALWPVP